MVAQKVVGCQKSAGVMNGWNRGYSIEISRLPPSFSISLGISKSNIESPAVVAHETSPEQLATGTQRTPNAERREAPKTTVWLLGRFFVVS
jgi:hypothetical protein